MRRWRKVLLAVSVLGLLAATMPAGASHDGALHKKMDLLYDNPTGATNSDLAFWGNYAVHGYYMGSDATPAGGFRIFDISNPAAPVLVRDFACDGLQADPILWDRNGNGVPDLLLLAVDRTMASPECGAPRTAHDDPSGWEGVRVFEMSDDPDDPFTTIEQVAAVYTDCGAHTITLWQGNADEELIVYVSSYPLRPGPTCGQANFANAANPYDTTPGMPGDPLHGVISVISVPVDAPEDADVVALPGLSYPGDPDGRIDWCERNLCAPGVLEPAAVACHDIVVHMHENMAGGACAEQSQVWDIDPDTGIPDTENPVVIVDDEVTSGGTGNIPGAVDFFHSVMFNNEGTVLNTVDESFGSGCPTMTTYQARLWNPAGGTHKTGRMFFSAAATGGFLSEFHVGDLRPGTGSYCSAHMGMAVMGIQPDLLVNAWYTGGVNVIDFSNPTKLREVAHYVIPGTAREGSDNWSAYPYTGPLFKNGQGIPVYATDGVGAPATGRGFEVFRTTIQKSGKGFDHLNPQTMD